MRSFLLQPYPFSDDTAQKLVVCGGIGLFITLFLALFEPFGFDELLPTTKWGHAALFGIVTFVIASFFQIVVPKLFPLLFREEGWRSWKEILFLLLTTAFIGAANYGLMLLLYPQNTAFASFFRAELITLQVGIFPISFIVFRKQMAMYRRYAREARDVTADLHTEEITEVKEQASAPEQIVLRGDNQKEELLLLPNNLFLISSADNYVQLYFLEHGVQKSMLMRSTLKKMEEQLAFSTSFFRCHRMYIVNLQLVGGVTGNAQGLKLEIPGLPELIPVSRNLTEIVKERLHQLSHSPQKT